MDLNAGKMALLQALALMSDEEELSTKIANLMDSVHEDKSRTVTVLCEALAVYKQDVEKKKKVVALLEEITKWWALLVEDREKLLLTISNLELEKEEIVKKQLDPQEIYGPVLDKKTSSKKRSRLMEMEKTDDDDFINSPKKPEVVDLDA